MIQKNRSFSTRWLFSTNIYSVFLILGIIDDDFLRMEHALSAITVLGIVLGVTLSLIPDDFFGKYFISPKLTSVGDYNYEFSPITCRVITNYC